MPRAGCSVKGFRSAGRAAFAARFEFENQLEENDLKFTIVCKTSSSEYDISEMCNYIVRVSTLFIKLLHSKFRHTLF